MRVLYDGVSVVKDELRVLYDGLLILKDELRVLKDGMRAVSDDMSVRNDDMSGRKGGVLVVMGERLVARGPKGNRERRKEGRLTHAPHVSPFPHPGHERDRFRGGAQSRGAPKH